ncbi:MAG: hypothetical protein QXO14_00540 [Desulfurococcaceae archaeon]
MESVFRGSSPPWYSKLPIGIIAILLVQSRGITVVEATSISICSHHTYIVYHDEVFNSI